MKRPQSPNTKKTGLPVETDTLKNIEWTSPDKPEMELIPTQKNTDNATPTKSGLNVEIEHMGPKTATQRRYHQITHSKKKSK